MSGAESIILIGRDQIEVPSRLRAASSDHVEVIAASMRERGQDTPIWVRPAGQAGHYILVAGYHRLMAAQLAGLDSLQAIVRDWDDRTARIAEIDENLIRYELDTLDRAVFLAERKRLYLEMHPETKKGGRNQHTAISLGGMISFREATAQRLGCTARTIDRAVALVEGPKGLTEAHRDDIRKAEAAIGRRLTGAELAALAAEEPEDRAGHLARWINAGGGSLKAIIGADRGKGAAADPVQAPAERISRLFRRWIDAVGESLRAIIGPSRADSAAADPVQPLFQEIARLSRADQDRLFERLFDQSSVRRKALAALKRAEARAARAEG